MTVSVLDELPGVGPAKQKALLKHFGSVRKLRGARVEEIEQVPGFGRTLAEKVAAALQSQQEDTVPAVNMTTGEVLS